MASASLDNHDRDLPARNPGIDTGSLPTELGAKSRFGDNAISILIPSRGEKESNQEEEAKESGTAHPSIQCHSSDNFPSSTCTMWSRRPSSPAPPNDRPRPFSLIEFGNLVSASLALDNAHANRFSESFLQFNPDLHVLPGRPNDVKRESQRETSYGNNGEKPTVIKIARLPSPLPSSPPSSPPEDSKYRKTMKLKLKANWIHSSRSRKILNKIKEILRHTTHRTPFTNAKEVQSKSVSEPQADPTTASTDDARLNPIPTTIPTVDLPSVFYKEQHEYIPDDQGILPFLPFAQQHEHKPVILTDEVQRRRTRPTSSDGLSAFSRASSHIASPGRAPSRSPSIHSDCESPVAPVAPASHGRSGDDNPSTGAVPTNEYADSIPSGYSSQIETEDSPSVTRSPAMASSSRIDPSVCGGPGGQEAWSPGHAPPQRPNSENRYTPSLLSYPTCSSYYYKPDWTLSLPLNTPLEVIYPSSTSSGSTRSRRSDLSGVSTYASSVSTQTRWRVGPRARARSCPSFSSDTSSSLQNSSTRHEYTTTTLVTTSSMQSWRSPSSSIDKPLPPLPQTSDGEFSPKRKGKQKEIHTCEGTGELDERLGAPESSFCSSPTPTPPSLHTNVGTDPETDLRSQPASEKITPEVSQAPPTPGLGGLKSTGFNAVAMRPPKTEDDQTPKSGMVCCGCREVDLGEMDPNEI